MSPSLERNHEIIHTRSKLRNDKQLEDPYSKNIEEQHKEMVEKEGEELEEGNELVGKVSTLDKHQPLILLK